MVSPNRFNVLGVDVSDVTNGQALSILEDFIGNKNAKANSIYFANANTLNLAYQDSMYRNVIQKGDCIFADGVGLRWAVQLIHGVRLKENVNGTDLIPLFFQHLTEKGYRYFLLGATNDVIQRAAANIAETLLGWHLVGYHHGYFDMENCEEVISKINASKADLLLVGMGNPRQEFWIDKYLEKLNVSLCIGVGGLFSYWSNDLKRAPLWIRRIGFEWLYLLTRQPHKFQRYIIGNPKFLFRIMRQRLIGLSGF